jgi:hypothetical protein
MRFEWGARGPEFKSRRPDQPFQSHSGQLLQHEILGVRAGVHLHAELGLSRDGQVFLATFEYASMRQIGR